MELSSPRAHLVPTLLLGLSLAGCLTGKSTIGLLDDSDGSSSTSGDGEVESSSSGGGGSTSASPGSEDESTDAPPSESDGGEPPPPACPPESQCSQALACAPEGFEECGGILGRSDDNGCPRQPCEGPGECPAGSSCYLPHNWGTCGFHGCGDDEELGTCECGFGLDCNNNGLCIPDEEGLPPDTNGTEFCGQHTDATACEGSGLPAELGTCRWYEGWQLPQDGVCEERVETGLCAFHGTLVGAPGPITPCPGNPSLSPLAFVDGDVISVLFVDPEDTPTSLFVDEAMGVYWALCESPEVADECACACE